MNNTKDNIKPSDKLQHSRKETQEIAVWNVQQYKVLTQYLFESDEEVRRTNYSLGEAEIKEKLVQFIKIYNQFNKSMQLENKRTIKDLTLAVQNIKGTRGLETIEKYLCVSIDELETMIDMYEDNIIHSNMAKIY